VMKGIGDGGPGEVGELGKILKGARAIRVMRLLRLAKLQRIIHIIVDSIQSEYTFIIAHLVKMLLLILAMNHIIACAWYALGDAADNTGERNWISVANMVDETVPYKYLTSLHWSLTQFTPASMDVSARNTYERIFSIVVLFFAMVAFSSIIGGITSSMTSLRNIKGDQDKQFWLLRRYLKQRSIPPNLSKRIFKFLEHRFKVSASQISESQVPIIEKLSEALQHDLTYSIISELLKLHKFFSVLDLK